MKTNKERSREVVLDKDLDKSLYIISHQIMFVSKKIRSAEKNSSKGGED